MDRQMYTNFYRCLFLGLGVMISVDQQNLQKFLGISNIGENAISSISYEIFLVKDIHLRTQCKNMLII